MGLYDELAKSMTNNVNTDFSDSLNSLQSSITALNEARKQANDYEEILLGLKKMSDGITTIKRTKELDNGKNNTEKSKKLEASKDLDKFEQKLNNRKNDYFSKKMQENDSNTEEVESKDKNNETTGKFSEGKFGEITSAKESQNIEDAMMYKLSEKYPDIFNAESAKTMEEFIGKSNVENVQNILRNNRYKPDYKEKLYNGTKAYVDVMKEWKKQNEAERIVKKETLQQMKDEEAISKFGGRIQNIEQDILNSIYKEVGENVPIEFLHKMLTDESFRNARLANYRNQVANGHTDYTMAKLEEFFNKESNYKYISDYQDLQGIKSKYDNSGIFTEQEALTIAQNIKENSPILFDGVSTSDIARSILDDTLGKKPGETYEEFMFRQENTRYKRNSLGYETVANKEKSDTKDNNTGNDTHKPTSNGNNNVTHQNSQKDTSDIRELTPRLTTDIGDKKDSFYTDGRDISPNSREQYNKDINFQYTLAKKIQSDAKKFINVGDIVHDNIIRGASSDNLNNEEKKFFRGLPYLLDKNGRLNPKISRSLKNSNIDLDNLQKKLPDNMYSFIDNIKMFLSSSRNIDYKTNRFELDSELDEVINSNRDAEELESIPPSEIHSEKTNRKLEKAYNKPQGYFDNVSAEDKFYLIDKVKNLTKDVKRENAINFFKINIGDNGTISETEETKVKASLMGQSKLTFDINGQTKTINLKETYRLTDAFIVVLLDGIIDFKSSKTQLGTILGKKAFDDFANLRGKDGKISQRELHSVLKDIADDIEPLIHSSQVTLKSGISASAVKLDDVLINYTTKIKSLIEKPSYLNKKEVQEIYKSVEYIVNELKTTINN